MYRAAATALKSVDSALQVGGPASAQPAWVGLLIDYCKSTNVPLDFVTMHAYPADTMSSSLESQMGQLRVAQRLADSDGGKPLLITEWSSGGTGWLMLPDESKAPPMHDEWQMGAWIIAAMLNVTDTPGIDLAAYSYWALSDVFTEQGLPQVAAQANISLPQYIASTPPQATPRLSGRNKVPPTIHPHARLRRSTPRRRSKIR